MRTGIERYESDNFVRWCLRSLLINASPLSSVPPNVSAAPQQYAYALLRSTDDVCGVVRNRLTRVLCLDSQASL